MWRDIALIVYLPANICGLICVLGWRDVSHPCCRAVLCHRYRDYSRWLLPSLKQTRTTTNPSLLYSVHDGRSHLALLQPGVQIR